MKNFLKFNPVLRLDGAMQMLEALEDMLEQQRSAISAQKAAISALKDAGASLEVADDFDSWEIQRTWRVE